MPPEKGFYLNYGFTKPNVGAKAYINPPVPLSEYNKHSLKNTDNIRYPTIHSGMYPVLKNKGVDLFGVVAATGFTNPIPLSEYNKNYLKRTDKVKSPTYVPYDMDKEWTKVKNGIEPQRDELSVLEISQLISSTTVGEKQIYWKNIVQQLTKLDLVSKLRPLLNNEQKILDDLTYAVMNERENINLSTVHIPDEPVAPDDSEPVFDDSEPVFDDSDPDSDSDKVPDESKTDTVPKLRTPTRMVKNLASSSSDVLSRAFGRKSLPITPVTQSIDYNDWYNHVSDTPGNGTYGLRNDDLKRIIKAAGVTPKGTKVQLMNQINTIATKDSPIGNYTKNNIEQGNITKKGLDNYINRFNMKFPNQSGQFNTPSLKRRLKINKTNKKKLFTAK
jgi:hypothetical protein